MSKGPKELLEGIKRKVKDMHNKNLDLEKKLQDLNSSLLKKASDIEALRQDIRSKESELETLKLAKAYQSGDSTDSEAKAKINEMVKEIDRCIALLNN